MSFMFFGTSYVKKLLDFVFGEHNAACRNTAHGIPKHAKTLPSAAAPPTPPCPVAAVPACSREIRPNSTQHQGVAQRPPPEGPAEKSWAGQKKAAGSREPQRRPARYARAPMSSSPWFRRPASPECATPKMSRMSSMVASELPPIRAS